MFQITRPALLLLNLALFSVLAACTGVAPDRPPSTLALSIDAPGYALPGQTITLEATVSGEGAATAQIAWSAEAGSLSATAGRTISWTAPAEAGDVYIYADIAAKPPVRGSHVVEVLACDSGSPMDETDPCVITTVSQLQAMTEHLAGHFVLGSDIDASETSEWNDGEGFRPVWLSGSFDGRTHTISNLYIHRPDLDFVGLFGRPDADAEISNVRIENATVSGRGAVGILAGESHGTVAEVHVSGTVAADNQAGGLVGTNKGEISNASSGARVTGQDEAIGGLVGANDGVVSDSNSNAVNVSGNDRWVGGLVGFNGETGRILNSTSAGSVTGTGLYTGGLAGASRGEIAGSISAGTVQSDDSHTGGLAGGNFGAISDSQSTATVTGSERGTGGLVGINYETGTITHSSSISNTVTSTGSQTGGLVGQNSGNIVNSYSSSQVDAEDEIAGGLVAFNGPGATVRQSFTSVGSSVRGTSSVGGLVGRNHGEVAYTYSLGQPVEGDEDVGGLVGRNHADISESYSIRAVTGAINVGGLVGDSVSPDNTTSSYWDNDLGPATSAGGAGRSSVSMLDQATYVGWDFDTVWSIDDGLASPDLQENPRHYALRRQRR